MLIQFYEMDELKTHSDLQFDIKVPFILTEELESLNNEGNRFIAYIVNQTGGEELRKILEFKINRME